MQDLFDAGTDDADRATIIFNIMALRTPSDTFLEELVKILTTAAPPMPGPARAAVGSYGVNIHTTSQHAVPSGDGPFLSIRETGGPRGIYDHNTVGPAFSRSTALITVRASTYAAARTMARAAYDALVAVTNTTITP